MRHSANTHLVEIVEAIPEVEEVMPEEAGKLAPEVVEVVTVTLCRRRVLSSAQPK